MKEKIIDTNISIDPDILLDEILFCATRYCIGRHTYVSSYARTHWSVISKNRDKFNQERLRFFAQDILSNVSQQLHFFYNIFTERDDNCSVKNDAYTLLAGYMEKHPDTDLAATKFTIDCYSGEVFTDPLENPNGHRCFTAYDFDLPSWIKLAKFILGASHRVTFKHPELGEHTADCIQVPDYDNERGWHIEYVPVNENWNSIVPPEWITKIEEICE